MPSSPSATECSWHFSPAYDLCFILKTAAAPERWHEFSVRGIFDDITAADRVILSQSSVFIFHILRKKSSTISGFLYLCVQRHKIWIHTNPE